MTNLYIYLELVVKPVILEFRAIRQKFDEDQCRKIRYHVNDNILNSLSTPHHSVSLHTLRVIHLREMHLYSRFGGVLIL